MSSMLRGAALVVLVSSGFAFAADEAERRPEGFSVGVGAGWTIPNSILTPNTTSVRFRLSSLTLEPAVRLGGDGEGSSSSSSATQGTTTIIDNIDEDQASGVDVMLGTSARIPVIQRGAFDFVIIGDLGLGWGSDTQNNDVNVADELDRTESSTLRATLGWGLGIEWFLRKGVSFSADAVNPLFNWTRSTTEQTVERQVPTGAGTTETLTSQQFDRTTAFDIALTFAPTVRAMFHIYF